MKTLIACMAAAFCGAGTKTPVAAPDNAGTATAAAVIRAMHGNARFLKDGKLHVYPVKYRPAPEGIELPPVSGQQFLFFAGIAAATGIAFSAGELTDPPDAEACAAVRRAVGVPECLDAAPPAGLCFGSVAAQSAFTLTPPLPEAFAAGALVGAALAQRDTDFIFSRYTPGEDLLFAREALCAYGVKVTDLVEGWRVSSRLRELPPLPEKLRRKRKYWIPGLRI